MIAEVFSKLLALKEVATSMSKRNCFRTHFGSQHVNGSQTLLKLARLRFYLIVPSIWDKLSWKKLHLVRSEILELFFSRLTANDKYTPQKSENFSQLIKILLPQKPKTFSIFFIAFVKYTSNFEYIEKKYGSHSLSISEITDAK